MLKGMAFHIQWTKVTWYSKLVAVLLFILVFAAGFYVGVQYDQAQNQPSVQAAPDQSAGQKSGWYGRHHHGSYYQQSQIAPQ